MKKILAGFILAGFAFSLSFNLVMAEDGSAIQLIQERKQKRQKRLEEISKCLQNDNQVRAEYKPKFGQLDSLLAEQLKEVQAKYKADLKKAQELYALDLKTAKEKLTSDLKSASTAEEKKVLKKEFSDAQTRFKQSLKEVQEKARVESAESKDARMKEHQEMKDKLQMDVDSRLKEAHQACVVGMRMEGEPFVLGEWTWRTESLGWTSFVSDDADMLVKKETKEQALLTSQIYKDDLEIRMEEKRQKQEAVRKCRAESASSYSAEMSRIEQNFKDEIQKSFDEFERSSRENAGNNALVQAARTKMASIRTLAQAARKDALKKALEFRNESLKNCR